MAADQDSFDLDALRIDPADPAWRQAPTSRKKRWKRQFIKLPWAWVDQLGPMNSAAAWRIATHLLYEHWRTSGKPITLSNVTLAAIGVARGSKWRALKALEQAGLIRIGRRPRKSPIVTLLLTERQ
jgi:hypothetical protein